MKTQLYANIERYQDPNMPINPESIKIIESDFAKVDWAEQGKFNVCFFDVSPVTAQTYVDFFEKVLPVMENDSIIVFSNYSNDHSSKELNLAKEKYLQNYNVEFEVSRLSSGLSDSTRYYSGILILHVKKPLIKGKTI